MLAGTKSYQSINEPATDQQRVTPWYWRLIALASSWMILAGYLMLPGLYAKDPQLKISQAVLSVFVVALLTAGYSFTALLCFAIPNKDFHVEGVFIPALTSSSIGVLSIAYNFILSRANTFGTAAITGTVISILSTVIYTVLIFWTRHRIYQHGKKDTGKNLWSEQSYYSNFIQNMYPTAARLPPHEARLSEDDRVNQQMALLLTKPTNPPQPSPEMNATFHINLPEDRELQDRQLRSQELAGSSAGLATRERSRNRAASTPDSLGEEQAWQRWADRGRLPDRPQTSVNAGGPSGTNGSAPRGHSRTVSREERRREIELGLP